MAEKKNDAASVLNHWWALLVAGYNVPRGIQAGAICSVIVRTGAMAFYGPPESAWGFFGGIARDSMIGGGVAWVLSYIVTVIG